MAGRKDFTETITLKIKEALEISKIKDNEFRFTRIDVKGIDRRIEISMEVYAKSIETVEIKNGKQDEQLTREEMKILRKYIGKLN